jgi:hypothetical protein
MKKRGSRFTGTGSWVPIIIATQLITFGLPVKKSIFSFQRERKKILDIFIAGEMEELSDV